MTGILKTTQLPYCRGCGHDLIAKNSAKALENLGLKPLEVIVVTDIGCHGIIDGCLNTHTVHGLHGRSVALGAGIAFGSGNAGKKIIVFIGDGGSTIGLQHILEAARLNVDMTVIVHNNMLYGMTGGQTSGLTPCGFRTSTSVSGNPWSGYDLCALAHISGAAYAGRVAGIGDISASLQEAIAVKGFSLIEVIEICPGYGVKLNPGRKLTEIMESSGRLPGKWENNRDPFRLLQEEKTANLIEDLNFFSIGYKSGISEPLSVVLSGSAGEGVQLAAGLLSAAAVRSGCHVTQKGSYPVTVGVGFSSVEIVISPEPVGYHGIEVPDVLIVTSEDGLTYCKKKIEAMEKGLLFIDSSLEVPVTGAEVHSIDFRSIGARSACLFAVFCFVSGTGFLDTGALYQTAIEKSDKMRITIDRIMELLTRG